MCVNNAMQLSLNGDTFARMKEDFDQILANTIGNMETKGADEATITLKLGITLTKEQTVSADDESKEITKPTFKHDINSVMQVKAKLSGSLSGDYELVWDDDEDKYVMRRITDGQMTLFDAGMEGSETPEELVEKYAADEDDGEGDKQGYDVNTPFGWLYQFIGEKLNITESMGNYTVRTEDNKIILSSATDKDSVFYCLAEKLEPHVGHTVVCVGYGGETVVNIAIECEDCCETLFSLDADLEDEDEDEYVENGRDDGTGNGEAGYEYDEPEE